MLAKRIATIMPELSYKEKLELTKIYSISGCLDEEKPLVARRPFRMPYHAITAAALLGGGRVPKPGEISLAHCGVLFLDEFPEFDKKIIEEQNNISCVFYVCGGRQSLQMRIFRRQHS